MRPSCDIHVRIIPVNSVHTMSVTITTSPTRQYSYHSRGNPYFNVRSSLRHSTTKDRPSMHYGPSRTLCDPCEHVMSITITRKHSHYAMGIPCFNVRCSIRHRTKKCRLHAIYSRVYSRGLRRIERHHCRIKRVSTILRNPVFYQARCSRI